MFVTEQYDEVKNESKNLQEDLRRNRVQVDRVFGKKDTGYTI